MGNNSYDLDPKANVKGIFSVNTSSKLLDVATSKFAGACVTGCRW